MFRHLNKTRYKSRELWSQGDHIYIGEFEFHHRSCCYRYSTESMFRYGNNTRYVEVLKYNVGTRIKVKAMLISIDRNEINHFFNRFFSTLRHSVASVSFISKAVVLFSLIHFRCCFLVYWRLVHCFVM